MTPRSLIALCLGACVALTACSGGAGSDSSAAALRAMYGQPARIDNNAVTMQPTTPTPQPAQISPTETPDYQPATAAPVQIIDTTQPPIVQVEVTRIVEVVTTPTPQPAQIGATCDAAQPAPTVALDDSDRAAGVVLRGQWAECVYATAVAAGMVQP